MKSIEKRMMEWADAHIDVIFLLMISVIGLCIRYPLRRINSFDTQAFLLPWYEEIKANGGLHALKQQVGDYNILYQFLICIMTYLPVEPLYGYKYISIIGDYILAYASASLIYQIYLEKGREIAKKKAILVYALVLLSYVVISNSSAWGQCDSLYSSFVMLSLTAFYQRKYKKSFVLLGVALCFKLQAIFILPFYLFMYYYERKHSILHYLLVPVVMLVSSLPALIWGGRNPLVVFQIYANQTNSYQVMYLNYPSFWNFLPYSWHGDFILYWYMTSTIFATIAVLALIMYLLKKSEVKIDGVLFIKIALILVYTCVLFLPSMHDRYGYLYEILSVLLAVMCYKTIPYAAVLHIMALYLYSGTIGVDMMPVSLQIVAWVNVAIYVLYIRDLISEIEKKKVGDSIVQG